MPSMLGGMRRVALLVALLLLAVPAAAQDLDASRRTFETRCGRCHGADGNGTEMGPPILQRITTRDDTQLATLIHDGVPLRGMPPNPMPDAEAAALVRFLRSIQKNAEPEAPPRSFRTATGTITGVVLGEGFDDLQIRTADGRVRLLRRSGDRVREVTSGTPWPSYNGDPRGNRYTTLTDIDKTVSRLAPKWTFALASGGNRRARRSSSTSIMRHRGQRVLRALAPAAAANPGISSAARGTATWANRGSPSPAIVSSWPPTMRTCWR